MRDFIIFVNITVGVGCFIFSVITAVAGKFIMPIGCVFLIVIAFLLWTNAALLDKK